MKIDFQNTERAFIAKTDVGLKKAHLLFNTISKPSIVSLSKVLLNVAFALRIPINWAVKPTIYSHFVGGESIEDANKAIRTLEKYNVLAILDYSVEGKESEEDIQSALEETLRAIKNAGQDANIPCAVFKPTAFSTHHILTRASSGEELTEDEALQVQAFKDRIDTLCGTAFEVDIPILIDAEDVCFQAIIDEVTNEMMAKYNTKKCIVFNTFQMYRTDRLDYLKESYQMAVDGNYYLGAKFVRGAYMEKERARAKEGGYPDPIHPNKDATDNAYNTALKFCIENIDRIYIFNGTHNEYSTQYLVDLMEEHGLAKDDKRCLFSQLYGMSDNLSFNIAAEGYNVAKYLPYGPVKFVMPYLIRRAEENTAAADQSGRELNLITKELKRRKSNK